MDEQRPINQSSTLLNLPAELRNMIYSFCLTVSGTVACAPYAKDGQTHQKLLFAQEYIEPDTRANMFAPEYTGSFTATNNGTLKLVCRQFNQETSMLRPVNCRELVFPLRKHTIESTSVICARYLETLTAPELAALERIQTKERIPHGVRSYWKRFWHIGGIAKLVPFCRANPDVTVRVLFEFSIGPDMEHVSIVLYWFSGKSELCTEARARR
jgi:hypothetical protein